jgi:lipid II:glycine glycyltransferase (peptidoglycan interpeptide bridge formation enzyme)
MFNFSVKKSTIDDMDSNGELLQTGFWARLKCMHGWTAHPFRITVNETVFGLLLLAKRIGPGVSIGYVPMGPLVAEPGEGREELLESLGSALRAELPREVAFVRYDLNWYTRGNGNLPVPLRKNNRLVKSSSDIQPPNTVILNLEAGGNSILSGMKSKTRYNIKLAEKKGVIVSEGNIEDLRTWYELYKETALRDKIAIHSFGYYKSFFDLAKTNDTVNAKLLLAHVEGKIVAGIILAIKDARCTYLYGASSNEMRNYMPNHALQWHAIRLALESGCMEYDFFGIPAIEDPSHPMYGLYRFKTGFGGEIVNRYGCYDLIYKPLTYKLYNIAESLRMFYYRTLKKRI